MRVLIIGGGGREHALAWKMAQSSRLDRLYCLPGNAGIAALADCPEVDRMEEGEVLRWSLDRKIRLVVFGPEAQLVAGWADGFRKAGLLAFGPGAEGAALEGSKVWAKQFMAAHKIPTAPFVVAGSYDEARRLLEQRDEGPVVVKADGLAAGKGVIVARNLAEAEEALDKIMKERAFGSAGERVVIEECLSGEEASVLAITDGSRLLVLPAAQDHKAIGEGDRGPNTGGMGSYSPAPVVDAELASQVEERVFRPLLKGLAQRGIDYRGVIYAGLMIRDREINVLEFNVRFGDPETQALMPRLDADLLPILEAAARGDLGGVEAAWKEEAAVCVVMASEGYPGKYRTGEEIRGLEKLKEESSVAVFHAGTAWEQGKLVTAGGRVLGVTAWDRSLARAVEKAYRAVEKIEFRGCYYRRDIAHRALK
ncbi:MAG: phosphoribosylamine--glycine ligase [Dethiobacteria bacterium]|nr:phosphoribosylamine--glycine ligase [Bacillota bacterium]HOP68407.1 phosphoribosylamine--glycine ligase [Bacillota bacterium]HPT33513.1 phosphoribosylamine--glycine ligase [Bacillota bacterium]